MTAKEVTDALKSVEDALNLLGEEKTQNGIDNPTVESLEKLKTSLEWLIAAD